MVFDELGKGGAWNEYPWVNVEWQTCEPGLICEIDRGDAFVDTPRNQRLDALYGNG